MLGLELIDILTIVGFLAVQTVAVLGAVWRISRRAGAVEMAVEQHGVRLLKHDERFARIDERFERFEASIALELEKAVARVEVRLEAVADQFLTVNGEPRYVSYKALDKIRDSCQRHLLSEMGHVRDETAGLSAELGSLVAEVGKLIKAVAVLSDRDDRRGGADRRGGELP